MAQKNKVPYRTVTVKASSREDFIVKYVGLMATPLGVLNMDLELLIAMVSNASEEGKVLSTPEARKEMAKSLEWSVPSLNNRVKNLCDLGAIKRTDEGYLIHEIFKPFARVIINFVKED